MTVMIALMSAQALLSETSAPTRDAARRALAGNLCRCAGHQAMVDAVLAAAKEMRSGRPPRFDPSPPLE